MKSNFKSLVENHVYEAPSLIEYGNAAELILGSSCYIGDGDYGYYPSFEPPASS